MELAACFVHLGSSRIVYVQAKRVVSCLLLGASVQFDADGGGHSRFPSLDVFFSWFYVAVHGSFSFSSARKMVPCCCIGRKESCFVWMSVFSPCFPFLFSFSERLVPHAFPCFLLHLGGCWDSCLQAKCLSECIVPEK